MRDLNRYWTPAVSAGHTRDRLPPVGAVIAFDRKPWRVLAIDQLDPLNWSDRERDAWQEYGMPDPWDRQPVRVRVEPIGGGKARGLRVEPWHYSGWYSTLPEHYAICVSCGELAPCTHLTAQRQAVAAMEAQDKQDRKLMPGCCPGCGEPVTSRQEAVTFPGPNLLSPLAHDSPTFHLRRRCRGSAERYEEMWVQADPSRPRSLLTLTCTGSVTVHHDRSRECHGAIDSDCPDPRAKHRSYSACYALSHGCPRGCPREGHRGC